jgi:Phosphotransferase enzyme family
MATQTQPDRVQYRLIVTRRSATEVLLSKQLPRCALPKLDVPARTRVAEQLVASTMEKYQLETYCLWTGSFPSPLQDCSPDRYAVMEARHPNDDPPPGTEWILSATTAPEVMITAADQSAIRISLENLNRYLANPDTGPFARPGWIQELLSWVEDQLEPIGLRLTGGFQQINASPTFSLVRLETTGAAVWFKATGTPNRHELGVSVILHRLFPSHVPRVLGIHPSWNGWLCEEIPGPALQDLEYVGAWVEAARALAELQISSVDHTQALLESGCSDLRLRQLAEQVDPFLARMSELMALQTKQPPDILANSELSVLGDRLKNALYDLQQFRLPNTLGHRDLNPRNVIVSPSGPCFIDWAEGCVTHPLVTFEYLREHAQHNSSRCDTVVKDLWAAYLRPWQAFFDPEVFSRAAVLSPLLAVFVYAVAGGEWRSPEILQNPSSAGYFRALTRRAFREANRIRARSDRCPV